MKAFSKLSAVCLIIFVMIQACSSGKNDHDQERDDSIKAAAAADSMLNDVLDADTTAKEKVAADSDSVIEVKK